jgi:exodeoxyribonuclease-5
MGIFDDDLDFGPPPRMEKKVYLLNPEQQYARDWLVDFCLGKKDFRKVLLTGYAGTGKTFTINRMVEAVRERRPEMNFGMTAPTHKAVKVLKKHSDLRDLLDFGTIHSFLGLKQSINAKGEVEYKPEFGSKYQRRIDGIQILILDEASMLDDKLHTFIEQELASNRRLRVIYMGDERQIPPVGKKQKTGEANAIPFIPERQKSHSIHVLALTQPQRQAKGSQIIGYATAIREQHLRQKIDYTFPDSKDEVEVLPRNIEALRSVFRKYFCGEEFKADADYCKVIAWRNDTVDYFNREIRLLINNAVTLPWLINEDYLIMDAPLVKEKNIIFPNNEEVVASEVRLSEKTFKYRLYPIKIRDEDPDVLKVDVVLKCYDCLLTDQAGTSEKVQILHEDAFEEYKKIRDTLTKAARECRDHYNQKDLWKQFYTVQELFAQVKYNYAVTAHKSQGSTYDYCISMEWDIEENRDIEERNRIRYVAATRARHKLFIVK